MDNRLGLMLQYMDGALPALADALKKHITAASEKDA